MVTTLTDPETGISKPQGAAYKYDQLNRLIEMKAFQNIDVATNTWGSGTAYNGIYENKFTYDANGNIVTQKDSFSQIFISVNKSISSTPL